MVVWLVPAGIALALLSLAYYALTRPRAAVHVTPKQLAEEAERQRSAMHAAAPVPLDNAAQPLAPKPAEPAEPETPSDEAEEVGEKTAVVNRKAMLERSPGGAMQWVCSRCNYRNALRHQRCGACGVTREA
jgi:hypothetical protein